METTKQNPIALLAAFRDNPNYRWPIDHISYDQRVTDDFDFYLAISAVHDGTVHFSTEMISQIFDALVRKAACKQGDEERHQQAGDVAYIVGDLIHMVEDAVIGGKDPGIREQYRLMVKSKYTV